jgi:HK97 family phage prohead protease
MNIETRASEVTGVSFPKRLIELIVMPYETMTEVAHRGRMISEIVSRGAFDGIERRPNRVKVNRDHKRDRTIGKAVALHPSRQEGLIAEVKISPVPLGDETLVLAEDGILDASAGFGIMDEPGAEVWETRSRHRLNKLWLDHIALVPDPAYETANVLAVREAPEPVVASATPNLDRVRLEQWRRELDMIDARYGL